MGISDKASELVFREYSNHGLSTFSREIREEHSGAASDELLSYQDHTVKVVSLRDVAKQYGNEPTVHFMKIDVEGYEYEVISGNDWKVFRPELICIEANHVKHDWRPILRAARYDLVFNDGVNEYYLRHESSARLKYFDYARDLVLSGIIINPGVAKRIIEGEEDKFTVLEQGKRINRLVKENANLERQVGECMAHLSNRRFLLRALLTKSWKHDR